MPRKAAFFQSLGSRLAPHRKLQYLLPVILLLVSGSAGAQVDLTGTWVGDDHGYYYLRQIGSRLWWAGLSTEPRSPSDFHEGLRFTNVFSGVVNGNTVTGEWANVPRGTMLNFGTLTLTIVSNDEVDRQNASGEFTAKTLTRTIPPAMPPDIFSIFDLVKKNQNAFRDHSLLDNLKPAKPKPIAILGNIIPIGNVVISPTFPYNITIVPDPDPVSVGYLQNDGRFYQDFICLDGNDHPPDGDLNFDILVDRPALDKQLTFWGGQWETNHGITAENFRNKLYVNTLSRLHAEAVMYGGTTECGDMDLPTFYVPGWQQPGSSSVLFNGRPISGQLNWGDERDDHNSTTVISILGGKPFAFGDRVRVTGILVLDCGHGWTHDCGEDDTAKQNQEIHPVYAIDVFQDFRRRRPTPSLTGAWSADDAGTYYVRQVGNTVWWFGLSVDEGLTFANVFKGTLQNGQVTGEWADVPVGGAEGTSGSGVIAVAGTAGPESTTWTVTNVTGGFSGSRWEKMYDSGSSGLAIVFESAEMDANYWPEAPEPFELTIGDQRVVVQPSDPQLVSLPDGRQVMRAALNARLPIEPVDGVPFRLSASFTGYRAAWNLAESDRKAGTHVQRLSPPRTLPLTLPKGSIPAPASAVRNVPLNRDVPVSLPGLAIHYRIEAASRAPEQ